MLTLKRIPVKQAKLKRKISEATFQTCPPTLRKWVWSILIPDDVLKSRRLEQMEILHVVFSLILLDLSQARNHDLSWCDASCSFRIVHFGPLNFRHTRSRNKSVDPNTYYEMNMQRNSSHFVREIPDTSLVEGIAVSRSEDCWVKGKLRPRNRSLSCLKYKWWFWWPSAPHPLPPIPN